VSGRLRSEAEIDAIVSDILTEIEADEAHFAATVKAGDRVAWREWVWSRDITGNSGDPETSEHTEFTGTVLEVARGVLRVDASTVTPTVRRQHPRYALPVSAFRPVLP